MSKENKKGYPFVKIADGVIIKESSWSSRYSKYNPKGVHYYIAKYDKNRRQYSFYPTSHYVDPEKRRDVRKGNAILMRIEGNDGLSTVYSQPRKKNVHGQPFLENFDKFEYVGQLSSFQTRRFDKFLSKKQNVNNVNNKKQSTHKK